MYNFDQLRVWNKAGRRPDLNLLFLSSVHASHFKRLVRKYRDKDNSKKNSSRLLFFITFASSCWLLHQSHWRRRPQVGVDNPFRPSASSTENKGWKLRGRAAIRGSFPAPRRRRAAAVSPRGQRASIKRPSLAPHSSQWIFFPAARPAGSHKKLFL